MNYILHGATNWGSSNFGDFIYGNEIYSYLKNGDEKNIISFYQPSGYFKKYISGYNDSKKTSIKDADCLVYIPGGYFGEGHGARLVDVLIQSLRFMPFGLLGVLKRKKIMILGVGAGPIKHIVMRWPIKKICSKSQLVTVRDEASKVALERLGIEKIRDYGDMILAYDLENKAMETTQTRTIRENASGKKILLVHYNHSVEALEIFAKALNAFLKSNNDYYVVVAADSVLPYEQEYYERFKSSVDIETNHYLYEDPYEMLQLLKMSDAVLTCKLHVGVVALMFCKSVICAAEHPEKTKRFYAQIGQSERCVSLYDTTSGQVAELLEQYSCIPGRIPEKVSLNAKKHWKALREAINL